MKVITPEISWHERDPIYSVDFQPGQWSIQRLASGGVDKIVRIWQLTIDVEGKGDFDFLSNLRRHTATVNIVRFSKDGSILATAGDDTAIILWKLSDVPTPANNIFAEEDVEEDKEVWVCYKTLRGHLGDVADLSWSKDSRNLVSGSVDNTAILWDVVKGTKLAIFNEHKSYVQGVSFDPLGSFVATLSADRSLRIYNLSSKSCVNNTSRLTLPPPPQPTPAAPTSSSSTSTTTDTTPSEETATKPNCSSSSQPENPKAKAFRIFHDDGLRSFFRRLEFSPCGQLLITPAGCMEVADKVINTAFIFSRATFAKPAVYLPSGDKSSTVVRVNPQLFELRASESNTDASKEGLPEWEKNKSMFCLPYRVVFAVATEDCVLLYDSQQTMPVGMLKNIHYHQLSDLAWSSDGRALVVASTDGFCTVATFEEGELGVPYRVGEANVVNSGDAPSIELSKVQLQSSMEVDEVEVKTPAKSVLNVRKVPKKSGETTPKQLTPNAVKSSPNEGLEVSPAQNQRQDRKTENSQMCKEKLAESVEMLKIDGKQSPEMKSVEKKIEHSSGGSSLESKKEQIGDKIEVPKKKRIQFTTLSLAGN